ncbi:MAG: hypothetical protein JWO15_1398 [Sphingomonadales bacterium]|nr:hypothetical protein [Sphingomonadales bacterium]
MKLHSAIAHALGRAGVDTMFGVLGDANLFMVESFQRECSGRYIAASNEAGAVLMALGYATVSNRVGVATTTYGPALTNTLTALVEGVKGKKPMLLLCGDTASEPRGILQDIPQREHVIPTGAGFEQARSPQTAVADLMRAMRRAQLELRPIVYNIPINFQWEEVEDTPTMIRVPDVRNWKPESADLDDALGILFAASRPIVLAGRGAMSSEAKTALIRLAARIDAPLATTLQAKGLFDSEPNNLGIFGTLSTPPAVDAIASSDCVIAFGASLNKYTSSQGAFLRGKRVVQVNLEPGMLGEHWEPTVGVAGDPAKVAEVMLDYLEEAEAPRSGFFTPELASTVASFSWQNELPDRGTDTTIDVRRALAAIDASFPSDRVVIVDGGRFMTEPYKMINVATPGYFVFTSYSGSIGLGLSYAIGAAAAVPGTPALLVTGDGGFMLGGLAEFNTAARYGIDLTTIVCNDSAYGAEHIHFTDRQMDPTISEFAWPEFAPVADSLGGIGITVRNMGDLARAVEAFEHRTRPLLIDLKLDPYQMPDRPR